MRIAQPRQSPRICLLTLSDEMEGSLSALMFNLAKYMYSLSGQGRMQIIAISILHYPMKYSRGSQHRFFQL